MAIRISLDNGLSFYEISEIRELMDELIERRLWHVFINLTEDEAREEAAMCNMSDTALEFLENYMHFAHEDLIIG